MKQARFETQRGRAPSPDKTGVPSGWRKATAGIIEADTLARDGAVPEIGKSRAVLAVKRVGAQIGLKAPDLLLLDTLAAFSQAQDWEEGRHPIVWPSNAYLMERTGFSLSTLKRHAKRLAEAGVVAFKDSPNGKRWGHRDADGLITEAYGFDLSPMSARAEELEALAEDLAAERALRVQLKRRITILRRTIRTRLEAAAGGLQTLWARFEGLLEALPGSRAALAHLERQAAAFSTLLSEVEEATQVNKTCETQEMNPKRVKNGPHIQTTKQLHSVKSNSSEKEERGGDGNIAETEGQVATNGSDTGEKGMNLALVLEACPEFAGWARNLGGYVRSWRDMMHTASDLRPMIGISEPAWRQAVDDLGQAQAAAALALVFDKVSTGEVSSPGGYLRGMVKKARQGELYLERSFYGRVTAKSA